MYWERTSGRFTENRAPVVRGLLPLLAAGLRQGLVVLPPQIEETGAGLGLLLLGPNLAPVATTPGKSSMKQPGAIWR